MYQEMETKFGAIPSRRSWRRSRISIPDRTSSLAHRSKKTRLRPKPQESDSVSLHKQSCKLFSSIDELLASNRETPPPRYSEATSRPYTGQTTNIVNACPSEKAPALVTNVSSTWAPLSYSLPSSRRDSGCGGGQADASRPAYDTVMSWTSDETRRREYEKIDRAHTGWRGLINKILPRSWKCGRRDFFRGEDDDDSVRRFRVLVPEKTSVFSERSRKWNCF